MFVSLNMLCETLLIRYGDKDRWSSAVGKREVLSGARDNESNIK